MDLLDRSGFVVAPIGYGLKDVSLVFYHAFIATLSVLLIALFGATVVVPKLLIHADSYIVVSGSMQPSLDIGDLIIVNPRYNPSSLSEGDVVTYLASDVGSPNGSIVIVHRIIDVFHNMEDTRHKFLIKGDNNMAADPVVEEIDITGEVLYRIPYIGYLMTPSNTAISICALALAMILVMSQYIAQRRKTK